MINRTHHSRMHGFSLIELMIGITLGLLIMTALVTLFIDTSRTNSEMAKLNSQIENGRFTIQLLQNDLTHAGFWGQYVPQFNDLTLQTSVTPADLPTATLPDPCEAYTDWNLDDRNNRVVLPVQSFDAAPTGCTAVVTNKQANTDVLVVRHAATCLPGVGSCEADTAGKLYFQSSLCEDELAAAAQGGSATTITLAAASSATDDFYNGSYIRIIDGTGAGQNRTILDYDGSTKVATISTGATDWGTTPDNTSTYTFAYGYVLGTSGFSLKKMNCTTAADKRKFISNLYYIRNYAVTAGDGIPTLMRSEFDLSGTLTQQSAQPLISGIEGFRVELGIDNISDDGTNVITDASAANRYTASIQWADDANLTSPTNRGDGSADSYVRCTTASPCTQHQLANVSTVKLYVLARADVATQGYTDTKVYNLGTTTLGPYNDGFKRHVFSTTVRLTNISGRRETP